MTAHAYRLKLRLFLEGIEIPIIAAQVQCAPNSPAVAAIQIPPLAEGTRLLPRTTVHLFFFSGDQPITDKARRAAQVAPEQSQSPTTNEPVPEESQKSDDYLSRHYRLLFCGEMVGFTWTKNAVNRSLVLQCEDFSNYWDYALQAAGDSLFGPSAKAVFSGAATNLFSGLIPEIGDTKASVITQIVGSGKCNTYPNLKGLAAGIVRLIEAIGGTYQSQPGSSARLVGGQNIFFSLAELRLHLTGMVAALENDETSSNLLQRGGYSYMFDRALGGMGGQTSLRAAISALTKIIFYETYPQSCPRFIPGTTKAEAGGKKVRAANHPDLAPLVTAAEHSRSGIAQINSQLAQSTEATQSEESPFERFARQGFDIAEPKVVRALIVKSIDAINKELLQTLQQALQRGKSVPPEIKSAFTKTRQYLSLVKPLVTRWRPGGPAKAETAIIEKLNAASTELDKVIKLEVIVQKGIAVVPARLAQQVLRPDIWFGAPPRCNVLFPDHYDTLQYRRAFLQEPTRFLLKTNDELFGEDALFDSYYFAPQAGNIKGEKAQLEGMLRGDLLDHELFTGILPVFEKMGEFNVFANRSGTVEARGLPKAGPAQRTANFLYLKHRFNARKMMISGKFNPYIAIGFPGLILDRYVDANTILTYNELAKTKAGVTPKDLSELLGTNFLGNFTQVTHTVSQVEARGTTEIACSYPRQVEESVEFLGPVQTFQKVKLENPAIRFTDIAALQPPAIYSFGPNLGRIVKVVDVTDEYLRRDADNNDAHELPLFDPFNTTREKTKGEGDRVVVGVPTDGRRGGDRVAQITGGADVAVTFRAFRLTEEVPRFRQTDSNPPIEDFVRPGWYGDIWTSANIGRAYETFFGTGSITDDQTFAGPDGAPLGQANELRQANSEEEAASQDLDPTRQSIKITPSLTLGDPLTSTSIITAVSFLQLTYSFIRQQGLDADEFIRAYTWRPIATMLDMFGTSDLTFSTDGNTVVAGEEGFHSRAFGDFSNLEGLFTQPVEKVLGSKSNPVAQKADTRARKRKAVQELASVMKVSRAVLG